MKNILITILSIFLVCHIRAQTVGSRGINTDPQNPQNLDINSPLNGSLHVLNNFYWFQTNKQFTATN
jgi:hypothetical protein